MRELLVLVIDHTPISALFVPCGLIFEVNKIITNRETEKRHRKGCGTDHLLYVLYALLWGRKHCLWCLRDDRNTFRIWQLVIIVKDGERLSKSDIKWIRYAGARACTELMFVLVLVGMLKDMALSLCRNMSSLHSRNLKRFLINLLVVAKIKTFHVYELKHQLCNILNRIKVLAF